MVKEQIRVANVQIVAVSESDNAKKYATDTAMPVANHSHKFQYVPAKQ